MKNTNRWTRRLFGLCLLGLAVAAFAPLQVQAGDPVCLTTEVRNDCQSASCSCDAGECSKEKIPASYIIATAPGCDCVCVVQAVVLCGTDCQCYPDGEEGPTSCTGLQTCEIDPKGTFCSMMVANGVVIVDDGDCGIEGCSILFCSGC